MVKEMKEKNLSNMRILMTVSVILLFAAIAVSPVMADVLPAPRHISVVVSNDAGAKFDNDVVTYGGPENSYYIKADGGGLNELHITNDPAAQYGQVTVTNDLTGTFWLSNTGGRGFDDDLPILVSVQGTTLPEDFAIHLKTSGYTWTPSPVANQAPTSATYVDGAVDETFTATDFIYGPQTWKPGPGSLTVPSLPLYFGQDINAASTAAMLMFVDPYVGNLKSSNPLAAIDGGAAKVEYSFTGVNDLPYGTVISFNGYGWLLNANQGQGISWTNNVAGYGSSVYTVVYNPIEATTGFIADVESLGLKPSVETGLTDKLNAVIDELNEGDEKAAVNIYNAFLKQVKAQTNKAITPEDASDLTAEAEAIRDSI
jgi:hypothetical protein